MKNPIAKRQLCLYTYISKSIYCKQLLLSSRDSETTFQFNPVPQVEIHVLVGWLLDNSCILFHRIAQLTIKVTFSYPELTKQCQQTWKNTKSLWYLMKKYFKNDNWTTQWDEWEPECVPELFFRGHTSSAMLHLLQFSAVKSENSTHRGTGHVHAGSALVHQRLSPWPLKKPVSHGWLPAKAAKLTSTVSKDGYAKDYADMWSI